MSFIQQKVFLRSTKNKNLKTQWSMILRLPETILFSRTEPAGMSILSPWLAMMITVPFRLTWVG